MDYSHDRAAPTLDPTVAQELCRSLALLTGSDSVSLIAFPGLQICSFPTDMSVGSELASQFCQLTRLEPMLWLGKEALRALPAAAMSQPQPAAIALVPVTDDNGPWGALLLSWREAPAQSLTHQRLTALIPFVHALCEHDRVLSLLQQRYERWQALYDTTVALTHELGSAELLKLILLRSIQLLRADGGGILLLDPARDELVVSVTWSLDNRLADAVGRRLKRGEGIAWQAIETRRPFVISDYDHWPGRADAFAGKRLLAALSVPLLGHAGPFGVINIMNGTRPGSFSEDDVHLVELFAQAAAAALEAADARQKSEELALRQEQARLAGELHDGLAQDLASLLLRADLCQQTIGTANVPVYDQLEAISRGLQKAIRDARATIWALRNPEPDECQLEEAVRAQIVQFEALTGVPVQYDIEGEACQPLSSARELVLLRAVQEALQNIQKHAHASRAAICLTWDTEQAEARVSISDDGRGLGPEVAHQPVNSPNRGVGLTIMRERIESVGGRVSIDAEAGRGITVRIALPLGDGMGDIRHA